MNLLYIADNGFSFHDGKFFCTAPNVANIRQYSKFFDIIHFIAREDKYQENVQEIDSESRVALIRKNDFAALYRAMKQNAGLYDIILTRNGINGCFAAIFAKSLGKPVIGYCGADPYEFQRSKGSAVRKMVAPVWRALEKNKMRSADYAQYCSEYLFRNYPTRHPHLICSNVEVTVLEADLVARLRKIRSPKTRITIGLLGKADENKGVRTVIRALAQLDERYSFELVGDGKPELFSEEIERFGLRERVNFLGYCTSKEKLTDWLRSVDVYVQPSLSEGLPRSTIEAMAVACPCIATNIAGLPELLEAEYLIKPKDDAALAEKLRWLVEDADAAEAAAKKNFEKAKKYDHDVRDKKLDAFYSRITEELAGIYDEHG